METASRARDYESILLPPPAPRSTDRRRAAQVDQTLMTGDAQPVKLGKGDTATMGCTVTKGEVQATVSATGLETSIGKRIGNDASIQTGEVANLLQVQQPMQSTLSHPNGGHVAPLAFA